MFWMQSPTDVGTEIGRQMHNLPCRSVGIILICILRCFQEFSSYTEETVTHIPPRVSRLSLQPRELQAVYSEWGKGGKVGRRPGPVKERGREASPVGLARGEAPGSWPSSPRGFYSK